MKPNSLPVFLRIPNPPYLNRKPLTSLYETQRESDAFAEYVKLWGKTGVITRVNVERKAMSRTDFWGILSLVASLAFCLGYYLAL